MCPLQSQTQCSFCRLQGRALPSVRAPGPWPLDHSSALEEGVPDVLELPGREASLLERCLLQEAGLWLELTLASGTSAGVLCPGLVLPQDCEVTGAWGMVLPRPGSGAGLGEGLDRRLPAGSSESLVWLILRM